MTGVGKQLILPIKDSEKHTTFLCYCYEITTRVQHYSHLPTPAQVYDQKKRRKHKSKGGEEMNSKKEKCLYNEGYDDKHYDYIIKQGEIWNERYVL